MRLATILIGVCVAVVTLGSAALWTRPAAAQESSGSRTRVEGVLTFIQYDGNDSTIGLKPDDGPVREIRLRQFPLAQLPTLVQLLNGGNRVAYEVARDNSANFFPAAIYAHDSAGREPPPAGRERGRS